MLQTAITKCKHKMWSVLFNKFGQTMDSFSIQQNIFLSISKNWTFISSSFDALAFLIHQLNLFSHCPLYINVILF